MGNEEALSKQEIIQLIEEGDRYAGIQFEELKGDFKIIMETYDLLDRKIDRLEAKMDTNIDRLDGKIDHVDSKLEDFRQQTENNFKLLFEDNQNFFREVREMRKEFSDRFNRLEHIS